MEPKRLIRVLIEQTGGEEVVSEDYYEKYKSEGIRFLSEYTIPKKVENKKEDK